MWCLSKAICSGAQGVQNSDVHAFVMPSPHSVRKLLQILAEDAEHSPMTLLLARQRLHHVHFTFEIPD